MKQLRVKIEVLSMNLVPSEGSKISIVVQSSFKNYIASNSKYQLIFFFSHKLNSVKRKILSSTNYDEYFNSHHDFIFQLILMRAALDDDEK